MKKIWRQKAKAEGKIQCSKRKGSKWGNKKLSSQDADVDEAISDNKESSMEGKNLSLLIN
jgi:hypothetical protein